MDDNKNVSVDNIEESIEYIREHFMKPLEATGESIIREYENLQTTKLVNEQIRNQIDDQKKRLADIREKLNQISEDSRNRMIQSSETIAYNQRKLNEQMDPGQK